MKHLAFPHGFFPVPAELMLFGFIWSVQVYSFGPFFIPCRVLGGLTSYAVHSVQDASHFFWHSAAAYSNPFATGEVYFIASAS